MCVCLCVLVDLWQAVWRLCVVEQKAQTVSCNHQYMTVKTAVSGNSSPSRNTQNLVVRLKLIHIHHSTPSMHTWKTWSLMECFKGQSNKSFISSSMLFCLLVYDSSFTVYLAWVKSTYLCNEYLWTTDSHCLSSCLTLILSLSAVKSRHKST